MGNASDPIPTSSVRTIQNLLRGSGNHRDAALWTCGPNWALRVSDLVAVTIGDVRDVHGIRESFQVKQRKTRTTVVCDNTPKVKRASGLATRCS